MISIGSFTIVARFFGRLFLYQKNVCVANNFTLFLKKTCGKSAFPKRVRSLIKTLVKEQLFHKCPRHWTKALGPVHFSRFVF